MTNLTLQAPVTPLAPPEEKSTPFISVIVPVRNEEKYIRGTLAQLLAQEYPADRFEVIVVDGESTDRTWAIVAQMQERHPQLRLLRNPLRWSSAARNTAVRAARGDVMVLVDGHCQLDDTDYLNQVALAFERSGADCLGRPQPLDVTGATALQKAVAVARSSRLGHHPASFIYSSEEGFVPPQSVAVAYRREVFDRVGLFDEAFDACEDVEFNHRVAEAGLRCFFTPRVRVRYHPRATLPGLFRQMVRYGRGRVRLLRKHPKTWSPAGFLPAAFLAGLVLGPPACLLAPALWAVYLGVVSFYLALILAFGLGESIRERQPGLFPWLVLVYPTIHLGAATGVWREAVARRPG
jgi:succinoglycan biosynthesis protein ExoA